MSETIIVAGTIRSGLTVTMQMLHAGGVACVGDPPAFEPHDVGDIPWDTLGFQAIKLCDANKQFPPPGRRYRVIVLRRRILQHARAWKKFAVVVGGFPQAARIPRKSVARSIDKDQKAIRHWAARYPCLHVHFEKIINSPAETAARIAAFLELDLDQKKMAGVVIQRTTGCYQGILEMEPEYLARWGITEKTP